MLLTYNEDNRPTAGQAMEHHWIQESLKDSKQKLDNLLALNALKLLKDFQAENKLK